jgi:hypothetical protein
MNLKLAMMQTRAAKLRAEIARLLFCQQGHEVGGSVPSRVCRRQCRACRDRGRGGCAFRPLVDVARELGHKCQYAETTGKDAGIRGARVGRSPVFTDADVAAIIQFSRSRSVYWKGPSSLRPPPREPKRPLTREEQGQRIREGKAGHVGGGLA